MNDQGVVELHDAVVGNNKVGSRFRQFLSIVNVYYGGAAASQAVGTIGALGETEGRDGRTKYTVYPFSYRGFKNWITKVDGIEGRLPLDIKPYLKGLLLSPVMQYMTRYAKVNAGLKSLLSMMRKNVTEIVKKSKRK
jgi:hypothetical protein